MDVNFQAFNASFWIKLLDRGAVPADDGPPVKHPDASCVITACINKYICISHCCPTKHSHHSHAAQTPWSDFSG